MAKQQQIIIYLMPIFFAISGVNFPIGVLIYWFTTNVWTMGQQWFVIRRMPTPGSAAEKKLEARNRAKGREHRTVTMEDLRKESEGKPKGRFMQAMEKAQEQAKAQRTGATTGATKVSMSKDNAGKKKGSSAAVVESTATEQPKSAVQEPARPAKGPQVGPRNQPKKNTPRAKRKKK